MTDNNGKTMNVSAIRMSASFSASPTFYALATFNVSVRQANCLSKCQRALWTSRPRRPGRLRYINQTNQIWTLKSQPSRRNRFTITPVQCNDQLHGSTARTMQQPLLSFSVYTMKLLHEPARHWASLTEPVSSWLVELYSYIVWTVYLCCSETVIVYTSLLTRPVTTDTMYREPWWTYYQAKLL